MAENAGGSPGLNKLADVISQQAQEQGKVAERPLVLDFGTIQPDMSLLTNTFSIAIPKSDYHVLRHLKLGTTGSILTYTGTGYVPEHGSHSHAVLVPESMRTIQPGDRVLVAWINKEAVVIDVVTKL